jgi:hypothetical protein
MVPFDFTFSTPDPPVPGEKLFLACLHRVLTHQGTTMQQIIRSGEYLSTIPTDLLVWAIAALYLNTRRNNLKMFMFYLRHLTRLTMDRVSFFLTEKGRFGRAPTGDVTAHHAAAIIGGAWVPYILKKHESHYTLGRYANVQGLKDQEALPGSISSQRIELR